MNVSIVWFRQDLRLADNPALQAALQRGGAIVPVYIDSPAEDGRWPDGAAARWWLRANLHALDTALRERGSRLVLARGPALASLRRLAAESGADAVFWNRRYEPAAMERDRAVKSALRTDGLLAESRNGALLLEPWEIANQSGRPFLVFTPYWKQLLQQAQPARPLPHRRGCAAAHAGPPAGAGRAVSAAASGLAPYHRVAVAARRSGARRRLQRFIDRRCPAIAMRATVPAIAGTSRLSPYLHVGAISPRQVWHAIGAAAVSRGSPQPNGAAASSSPSWCGASSRTTCCIHHPRLPDEPLRAGIRAFPWREDDAALRRGSADARASRWSMPACASCGPPAGCTTACAWWSPRSW